MELVLRVIGFVVLAVLGFFSAHLLLIGALQMNLMDGLPPDDQLRDFSLVYFGGAGWACILGVLIGLGCFFSGERIRGWLMAAPAVVPAAYSVFALLYFST